MVNEPKKVKLGKGKVTHNVRAAQAILQYGVGAMVDFPDQTLMTAAPEYWSENDNELRRIREELRLIRDERLERQLGVDYFAIPHDKSHPNEQGIAYTRFPRWYFCPKCRRLEPLSFWLKEYRQKGGTRAEEKPDMEKPVCLGEACRGPRGKGINLVPARIVVACDAGHIDDFPWIEWVHAVAKKDVCGDPHLKFKTGVNSSAGLEGLTVSCENENCKAKATLEHSFDKNGLRRIPGYDCHGRMPWRNERESCGRIPQAKQRGASVVYYPKVDSSLVIPPYSDRLRTKIISSAEYIDFLSKVKDNDKYNPGTREVFINTRLNDWVSELSSSVHIEAEIIGPILITLLTQFDTEGENDASSEVYRQAEYSALNGSMLQTSVDDDFEREERNGDEYNIRGVSQVALLHKIREVRALVGFTRLDPASTGSLGMPPQDAGRFQCVKKPDTRWYPGYEVRGEGIFIQFDNDFIVNWLATNDHVESQITKLRKNAALNERLSGMKIDPKFIFLHTLSHLLIQRLSFESGYNSASLRERIYCDLDHPEFPMCGIFIYTACGDSEGTLGGLVRQGLPGRLRKVFASALESARWCSNDPVCGESGGQGRNAMNLAACHACALLPETSCEEFNVLLDRTLLIGRITDRNVGFFSSWLDGISKEESPNAL
ncbi:protein of unknown function (DUF1998) [Desulfitobacterium dehalogenans ATCC 51507]|uniref:MrfA-like Zn-binding domain-containing protein n=1 Tax=Desulfitobacterium dehalogenans (strain ATCC 51507 / DSM 9161 / JW/IU-DC1) TaxID=756499 RepID=I4A4W2_DESDJ|nr:DUF1998 domain-containing protein [Desulfitobacterium dehalogenans]AFL98996.1 protein of unknown function (DUF1998) [Desulfitobacterium dehalogenans ATCC 51507]